jgi:hypothetical protein
MTNKLIYSDNLDVLPEHITMHANEPSLICTLGVDVELSCAAGIR